MARIHDYAIIGDGRSAALVSSSGSIDWLCWPRFDSPSLFAAVLDRSLGGRWQIAPTAPFRTRRHYHEQSNVLVTELITADGVIRITDLMPVYSEEDKRHVLVPEHELLRIVDGVEGDVELELRFEPRPDYARRPARLRATRGLGVRLEDGPHLYSLRGETALEVKDGEVVSQFVLRPGERRRYSLTFEAQDPAVLPPLGEHADEALERTARWWKEWAARCRYSGPYRGAVIRSLLVLKLLGYAPSGSIVAAPTTSLPERVGAALNWDYRYCWLRDASLTVHGLLELGYTDEANAFVAWLLHGTRLTRPRLSVLYDVHGRLPKSEVVLAHLEGYAGSQPVRIRNAAVDQIQLDVYGEVIDVVAQLARRGACIDRETSRMMRQFGEYICEHWRDADQGIWEPRIAPQHHTHSRLLCWTGLDRLLELDRLDAVTHLPTATLRAERELIRRDIEEHSYSEGLQSYTQVQGSNSVDASALLLPWYGYISADDPRMRSTFARIRQRLEVAPKLLYRYEQSHAAGEGAFALCSFWAAEYLARGGGSLAEADDWFWTLARYANDVGLFAEEIDPRTGEALGNTPQAYTHVGLISAALALEERRRRERRPSAPRRAPRVEVGP